MQLYQVYYAGTYFGDATLSPVYGIADGQARALLTESGIEVDADQVTLVRVTRRI